MYSDLLAQFKNNEESKVVSSKRYPNAPCFNKTLAPFSEYLETISYDAYTGSITTASGHYGAYYDTHRKHMMIRAGNRTMRVDNLIWFITHGVFPEKQIVHVDGNKKNLKLENLVEGAHKVNAVTLKTQKDILKNGVKIK